MSAQIDWQQIIALGIVAIAAFAVGRRLLTQILAFRKPTARPDSDETNSGCGGCTGCGSSSPAKASSPAPLVQIQLKPPVHLKRPSSK